MTADDERERMAWDLLPDDVRVAISVAPQGGTLRRWYERMTPWEPSDEDVKAMASALLGRLIDADVMKLAPVVLRAAHDAGLLREDDR